jgi:hypothetical protein
MRWDRPHAVEDGEIGASRPDLRPRHRTGAARMIRTAASARDSDGRQRAYSDGRQRAYSDGRQRAYSDGRQRAYSDGRQRAYSYGRQRATGARALFGRLGESLT